MRTFLFLSPDAAFPIMLPCKDEESAPEEWRMTVPGPPEWMMPGKKPEPLDGREFVKRTAVRHVTTTDPRWNGRQAMIVYIERGYHPHVSHIWKCFDMLPHEIRGGGGVA